MTKIYNAMQCTYSSPKAMLNPQADGYLVTSLSGSPSAYLSSPRNRFMTSCRYFSVFSLPPPPLASPSRDRAIGLLRLVVNYGLAGLAVHLTLNALGSLPAGLLGHLDVVAQPAGSNARVGASPA